MLENQCKISQFNYPMWTRILYCTHMHMHPIVELCTTLLVACLPRYTVFAMYNITVSNYRSTYVIVLKLKDFNEMDRKWGQPKLTQNRRKSNSQYMDQEYQSNS